MFDNWKSEDPYVDVAQAVEIIERILRCGDVGQDPADVDTVWVRFDDIGYHTHFRVCFDTQVSDVERWCYGIHMNLMDAREKQRTIARGRRAFLRRMRMLTS